MKTMIDGYEIECSIDEFKELISSKKVVVHKNEQKIVRRNFGLPRKHWSNSDDRLLSLNSHLKPEVLHKKFFPYRTIKAITLRLGKLKHRHGRVIRSDDKRIEMMKFVSNRAKFIRKENPKISHHNAQKIAMNDYRIAKDTRKTLN